MSISGISSAAATGVTAASQVARKQSSVWTPDAATTSSTAPQDTFTSDFASILSSIQSGDITSAQAALTKLQADQPPADATYSPNSTSAASSSSSPGLGDLQSMLQAVQGGDINAAQTALTSFQADVQANGNSASASSTQPRVSGHHHHHHHAKPAAPPPDTTTDTSTTTSTDSSTTDLLASL